VIGSTSPSGYDGLASPGQADLRNGIGMPHSASLSSWTRIALVLLAVERAA
jgi:hypothetical protein